MIVRVDSAASKDVCNYVEDLDHEVVENPIEWRHDNIVYAVAESIDEVLDGLDYERFVVDTTSNEEWVEENENVLYHDVSVTVYDGYVE